jgi:hypothetical protein
MPKRDEFDLAWLPDGWEVVQLPPDHETRAHVAPALEDLIPAGLVDSARRPMSVRATDFGAPTVNRALRLVGVRPRDAVVVVALGGRLREVHSVHIFGVPGLGADELESAFEPAIYKPRRARWQRREIAGRTVWWVEEKDYFPLGDDFTAAWWTRDGLVIWITGQPAWLEAAVERLP